MNIYLDPPHEAVSTQLLPQGKGVNAQVLGHLLDELTCSGIHAAPRVEFHNWNNLMSGCDANKRSNKSVLL